MSAHRGYRVAVVAIALAAVAALGWVRPASAAGEKVELRQQAKVGEVWDFDSKIETSMTLDANGQEIKQASNVRRAGRAEVLAVKDGKPTALKVKFGEESTTSATTNGEKETQAFPLAGKTVTIRRDAGGKLTHDLGDDAEDAVVTELGEMLKGENPFLPKGAVAVGDEWDADPSGLTAGLPAGSNAKASLKCKLVKIGSALGRKTADLELNGEVAGGGDGVTATVKLGGTVQLDLQSGQPIQADILGKIGVKGPGVTGDGKLQVTQTMKPVGAAKPVVIGRNPLAPAAPANPFAGKFSGDGLTVDLAAGDGDSLSGTLALAGKSFPATAEAKGSDLTGSFETDGNKFDFTATLDADTLTLTSGGDKYTLKRAAANPLAKPAPKNPLAN